MEQPGRRSQTQPSTSAGTFGRTGWTESRRFCSLSFVVGGNPPAQPDAEPFPHPGRVPGGVRAARAGGPFLIGPALLDVTAGGADLRPGRLIDSGFMHDRSPSQSRELSRLTFLESKRAPEL